MQRIETCEINNFIEINFNCLTRKQQKEDILAYFQKNESGLIKSPAYMSVCLSVSPH
jgi:hypothetical protein